MPYTRLLHEGYGGRRAGSFAGKTVVITAPGLVTPSSALHGGLTTSNTGRGGLAATHTGRGGVSVDDGPRIEDL